MNPVLRALLGRLLGDRGERAAVALLKRRGLRILRRNYRTKHGEVDVIARDGGVVVFVEVKARRRGDPAEAVTPEKQRRLALAALHFLKRHRLLEHPCRFDVVAILWPDDQGPPAVEHYVDAFEPPGRGQMFR
jgi:putative endonuclease